METLTMPVCFMVEQRNKFVELAQGIEVVFGRKGFDPRPIPRPSEISITFISDKRKDVTFLATIEKLVRWQKAGTLKNFRLVWENKTLATFMGFIASISLTHPDRLRGPAITLQRTAGIFWR